MPVILPKFDETSIQDEHKNWLIYYMSQMPTTLNYFKNELAKFLQELNDEQFSILSYPEFWSGERLLETRIKSEVNQPAAYQEIKNWLKKQKQNSVNEPDKVKEIENFAQNYDRYFLLLKRKALILSVKQIMEDLDQDYLNGLEDEAIFLQFKTRINQILSQSSLLNMQTRYDCLQAHLQITLACRQAHELITKKNYRKLREEVDLIEVLAKRVIDSYYQTAKKMTLTDAIQKDVASLTSAIGLSIGLIGFALGIASFFFPPLVFPVFVLGLIGLISYLASVFTAIKIAEESFKYRRSPKVSEFIELIIEVMLSPFYFFAGEVFSLIGRGLNWAASTIKLVTEVWDNAISNILPDIFFAGGIFKEVTEVGSVYTKSGQLKNTTATSWSLIRSTLTANMHGQSNSVEVFEKIDNAKKYLTRQMGYRPTSSSLSRNALYEILAEQLEQFRQKPSLRASTDINAIEELIDDFLQFQTKINEKTKGKQLISVNQYKEEIAQANHYLYNTAQLCENYLSKHFDSRSSSQLIHFEQTQIEQIILIQEKTRELINLNSKDLDEFHANLTSKSLVRYKRGFVYTSLEGLQENNKNAKERDLPLVLSHHADILFWEQGFRGLRRSQETKEIFKIFNKYKALPADAKRTETLIELKEKCNIYLAKYGNKTDKPKKGHYQYVEKLSNLIDEEIKALHDNHLSMPILVAYKAR
ncbi:hypothetical protein ACQUW5_12425 [Legionella sp. CNM-1927-20]|uniref:hypothetical protein n=1 Tax=Legionella sp. CNM-1927-20 TaxID=3422221 RepID=UPI00403B197A